MKKAFRLLAIALVAFGVASCGGGEKKKEIKVDTTMTGSGAQRMSSVMKLEDVAADYSFTNDTKGSISKQVWNVAVHVEITGDDCKGAPIDVIKKSMPTLQLSILDKNGNEISGQKDYKLSDQNLDELCKLLAQGKGAKGVINFSTDTNNKDNCDTWFEDAVSAKITVEEISSSSSSSYSSGSSSESRGSLEAEEISSYGSVDYNDAYKSAQDEVDAAYKAAQDEVNSAYEAANQAIEDQLDAL